MKTPRFDIADTIAARVYHRGMSKELAQEIAAMLLVEGRASELDSIMRDVQAQWAVHGHVEALAYSAHPLTAAVTAEITENIKRLFPKAERVVITEVIDPSVVAGVRIRLAHQQLDLSIEAKLNKFKQLTGAGKE